MSSILLQTYGSFISETRPDHQFCSCYSSYSCSCPWCLQSNQWWAHCVLYVRSSCRPSWSSIWIRSICSRWESSEALTIILSPPRLEDPSSRLSFWICSRHSFHFSFRRNDLWNLLDFCWTWHFTFQNLKSMKEHSMTEQKSDESKSFASKSFRESNQSGKYNEGKNIYSCCPYDYSYFIATLIDGKFFMWTPNYHTLITITWKSKLVLNQNDIHTKFVLVCLPLHL